MVEEEGAPASAAGGRAEVRPRFSFPAEVDGVEMSRWCERRRAKKGEQQDDGEDSRKRGGRRKRHLWSVNGRGREAGEGGKAGEGESRNDLYLDSLPSVVCEEERQELKESEREGRKEIGRNERRRRGGKEMKRTDTVRQGHAATSERLLVSCGQ